MFRLSTRTVYLSAALTALLGWGGVREVQAWGACSDDVAECDFQVERTVLRAALWESACSPGLLTGLDPIHFDPKGGLRTPGNFVNGVCLAHRLRHDLFPIAAADATGLAPEDRAIDELQKAQSGSLLPSQRNVAALFEGLVHCTKLGTLSPTSAVDVEERVALRDRVCFHRAMAKASFAKVNFANLDLHYEDPATGSFEADVDAMSACYETYLNSDYDAMCGVALAPSAAEIESVGVKVASEILPNFFGGGDGPHGTPPISAMLARKVTMARAAMDGSREAFAQLAAKNVALGTSFKTLAVPFCEGAGCIPARVNLLADEYDASVRKTLVLSDVVDNWMNGLFKDGNGRDVRDVLAQSTQTTTENMARLASSPDSGHESNSVLDRLTNIKASLAKMDQGRDAAERATVAKVCRVYYCDILNAPPARFRSACRSVGPTGQALEQNNTLCQPQPANRVIADGKTAESICSEAGFDATKPCP